MKREKRGKVGKGSEKIYSLHCTGGYYGEHCYQF